MEPLWELGGLMAASLVCAGLTVLSILVFALFVRLRLSYLARRKEKKTKVGEGEPATHDEEKISKTSSKDNSSQTAFSSQTAKSDSDENKANEIEGAAGRLSTTSAIKPKHENGDSSSSSFSKTNSRET